MAVRSPCPLCGHVEVEIEAGVDLGCGFMALVIEPDGALWRRLSRSSTAVYQTATKARERGARAAVVAVRAVASPRAVERAYEGLEHDAPPDLIELVETPDETDRQLEEEDP